MQQDCGIIPAGLMGMDIAIAITGPGPDTSCQISGVKKPIAYIIPYLDLRIMQ
jgi:hypothetical protein